MNSTMYRVTAVYAGGTHTCTQISGSFGEDLSRHHFKEVTADPRCIFACVWKHPQGQKEYQTDTFLRQP